MKKFVCLILISVISFTAMAETKLRKPAPTSALVQQEILDFRTRIVKEDHSKLNSWNDIKKSIDHYPESDKSILLEKIRELESTPFQKPAIEMAPNGFAFVLQGEKIQIDIFANTITHQNRTLELKGKTATDVINWIEKSGQKTSFMSFFISEAYAVGPLVILIIAIVAISAAISGMIGSLYAIENHCAKQFEKMRDNLGELKHQCLQDRSVGRMSELTRGYVNRINNTVDAIIARISRDRSCEVILSDSVGGLCRKSQSKFFAEYCRTAEVTASCLQSFHNGTAVNNSGRGARDTFSRERSGSAAERRSVSDE